MKKLHWNRTEVLLVAGLVLLALLARVVPGERMVDDAYITFRYARNIVEGRGFVYNPGERVLGTTTPLYTLLMAGLALVTGSRDFPTLAMAVNALTGAVSVGLLYALGQRFVGHWLPAAAVAILWAVAPYSVTFAVGGMETNLTIALLLAAAYAHVTGHPRVMAALSAFALLARPDTAILLVLLWLDLLVHPKNSWDNSCSSRIRDPAMLASSNEADCESALSVNGDCGYPTARSGLSIHKVVPWREALITLGILAPWLLFSLLYFGSPLPASIGAKSVTYRLPPEAGLVRLIQHYSTPFFGHEVLGAPWQLIGFFVYLLLSALGGLRAVQRDRRTWPLLAYPYFYLTVFAAANPLLFRWYFSPPVPFYFLLIVAGVWSLVWDVGRLGGWETGKLVGWETGRLGNWETGRLGNREIGNHSTSLPLSQSPSLPLSQSPTLPLYHSTILTLFTVVALALTLNAWELHPDHGPDRPAPEMAWFKLELLYEQAAGIVLDHAQPGDTLCAGDIGMLGYRTGLHILDTVGLVTPKTTHYYPTDPDIYVINYAIPADLVLALDPDHIVILEVYGREGLLPDPRFQARYRLLEKLETDIYGSDGMLIFTRR